MDTKRPDIGLPPGSPIYVGDRSPDEMQLSVIGYDPVSAWQKTASSVEELLQYANSAGITWINVEGLKDSASIGILTEHFGIHPLTLEDILNTKQRPKVEEFETYLFIILEAISLDEDGSSRLEQLSLILMENAVITFQERGGDSFGPIRKRILNNAGRIRRMGSDYLAYGIIDSMVDNYFLVLDVLGAKIEDFEDRAIDESDKDFIPDFQNVKQELLRLRRAVWPLRESLSALMRLDSELIGEELEPFLRDLHDNVMQAAETIDSYRELLAGVMEVHLSSISNRMNNVMKVLTIISTIFIPISFIAGVYGMNFTNMPELGHPYGYYITLGVMALIALLMVLFFKRRKWF
ncbi:magnesium/cobalt transporter CorA [Treponema sp. OttesenSCG-928-L16]|nr:magnesium/cobalt transporter CorA [Treponema sp. OttesenSCG-928-L16]